MRAIRNFVLPVMMFAFAIGAQAQATRTWVSGVGDDVNPCSRTAPCKTWAGAISKTAAGGEINALDPGGFGTLTITKSIIIDGGETFASTLNSGGINGFVINDSATATPNTVKVIIRNVSINGAGTTLGLNGIRFISGKQLTVENVKIANQSGKGIDVQRSSGAPLGLVNITNSTINNCGSHAIGINATSTTGPVRVSVDNVRLTNSLGGLFAGFATEATIANSTISHCSSFGVEANNGSIANVDSTTIMNNGTGVSSVAPSVLRISRTFIIQNAGRGFNAGGLVQSYGDNYFASNGANLGVLTSISAQKQ
jgi:hypothetical protein